MPVYSITDARTIGQAPDAAPAQATDELPIRRGSGYGRLTVADIRAGLASVAHTHAVTDISDSGITGRSVVQAATPTSVHDAAQPNVAVTSNVSLTAAAHGGRRLHVSGTRTLTVDSATGFATFQSCVVYANSGDVTIAQGTGATVTPPSGETLVIRDGCAAELRCIAANSYRLTGGLVAV